METTKDNINAVRVRFAPSPTGHLHVGGARTALFNWLYARSLGGTFVLRIEDTDKTRSTDEFIDSIMEGMKWIDLDWDEGPFRQTDRFDIYKTHVDKLVKEGRAYHCYCSAEELEQRREEASKEGRTPKYDGRCRNLATPPEGIIPSIRFKMPQTGLTVVHDMIRGAVEFDNNQLEDLIIARSDGTPTYNFVVVVDDVLMKITHVIRGDDHLNNTPKQIHIYKAFDYAPPEFAHLPMILGADKTRLSKRHGATSVLAYRDMGFLPSALVNYLVRLGWSFGDQEVFTREELVKHFSLESVGKSAAVFNPDKLLWLNSEYMKITPTDKLAEMVMPFLKSDGTVADESKIDKAWLARAIHTLVERCRTLIELANALKYYINETVELDDKAKAKFITDKTKPSLEAVLSELSAIDDFTVENIEKAVLKVVEKENTKLGSVAQPVRVALTGNTVSPGIYEVIEIIGKERTLKRLKHAIDSITAIGG